MNNDKTDNYLRQVFHEIRKRDEQRAPAFEVVLDEAERRGKAVSVFPRFKLAAIAALLVAGAFLVVFGPRDRQPQDETLAWAALTDWQASTDVLLTMSDTPWEDQLIMPSDEWFGTDGSVLLETTTNN